MSATETPYERADYNRYAVTVRQGASMRWRWFIYEVPYLDYSIRQPSLVAMGPPHGFESADIAEKNALDHVPRIRIMGFWGRLKWLLFGPRPHYNDELIPATREEYSKDREDG